MSAGARVLVVDDEPQIRRALETTLRAAGYNVEAAATVAEALTRAAARPPDAVILDLVLPDGSGVDVCRDLRTWTQAPVVVLSVIGEEREKVAALDAGADDYVTKPFGVEELLARLRAALRRAGPSPEPVIELGELVVDLEKRRVLLRGERAPAHAARVRAPARPRPERGKALDPRHDPAGGLGPGVPDGVALPARLRVAASAQDRGRPRPAALPAHGAGRGLSPRRSVLSLFLGVADEL